MCLGLQWRPSSPVVAGYGTSIPFVHYLTDFICSLNETFRWIQGPFNKKENAMIVIMSSAAAHSALATEIIAVQRLYYNIKPNAVSSIFLLFSSQLIGYGIGGLLRRVWTSSFSYLISTNIKTAILLYPSKMLYPVVLPLVSMLDAFFKDGSQSKKRLRLFYIAFFA